MFTPGQVAGLIAFLVVIMLVAFALQKLNSAIMSGRINPDDDTEKEEAVRGEGKPKPGRSAPRIGAKRRHGR